MSYSFYGAIDETGGSTGAIDAIDGATLSDTAGLLLIKNSKIARIYTLEDSTGLAESNPTIINPDSNAGTKNWLLCDLEGIDLVAREQGESYSARLSLSSGHATLINESSTKNLTLSVTTATGAKNVLKGFGAGAVYLYYNGSQCLISQSDGIAFYNSSDTTYYMDITLDGTSTLLRSYKPGISIELSALDSTSNATSLIKADPDGTVELYYDGSLSFSTRDRGVRIIDITDSQGLDIVSNDANGMRLKNTVNSKYILFQGLDGTGSSKTMCVMYPETYTRIYYNGTIKCQTTSTGFGPSADNTDDLGANAVAWQDVYGVNAYTTTSDRNKKRDITQTALGLDFIMDLNPVSYRWKDFTYVYNDETDEEPEQVVEVKHHRKHHGLLAQDVKATLDKKQINTEDFAGYILDSKGNYSLRYAEFIAPIIKAIQEQQKTIEALQARVDALGG